MQIDSAHARIPEYARVLTPGGARLRGEALRATSSRAAASCSPPRAARQKEFDAGKMPDFLAETAARSASPTGRSPTQPQRPPRPPRRDHRAHRPQDGDQRAQLRRLHLHGGPRGRQLPDVGQHDLGPGEPAWTPCAGTITFEQSGKQYRLNEKHRGAHPAPARLAPRREARARRRQARVRRALRLRPQLLPQRDGAARARQRPLLLPAEDGVAPRGAALERHLHLRAEGARHPARLGARHGADRDASRGLRDGRDPVGAARPFGGPQHRPLGLHLLVHQEAALATASSASPTARR